MPNCASRDRCVLEGRSDSVRIGSKDRRVLQQIRDNEKREIRILGKIERDGNLRVRRTQDNIARSGRPGWVEMRSRQSRGSGQRSEAFLRSGNSEAVLQNRAVF